MTDVKVAAPLPLGGVMTTLRLHLRGLRTLSVWRATLAVLCGLLVVPAQPAWPVLTWLVFVPVGIVLWYRALDGIERLQAAIADPVVRRAAHLAVALGAMWVLRLFEPLAWLYAIAVVAAVVYAVAGPATGGALRARVLR
jgi:hypothetical protein